MSSSNFYDASSTALLASTVYRISLLWSYYHNLPIAERCRQTLFSSAGATPESSAGLNASFSTAFANMNHFTPDGYLRPVADPDSYGIQGNVSAEGQAFIIELQSAWRDWVLDGAKGANGASATLSKGTMALWTATWVGAALAVWFIV